MVDSITSATPQVLGGKLRALAINGARRSATLPDVPTYIEAGLTGFQSGSTYQGMWGPAGLPQPGKSYCFFCPSMKKQEILYLKEHYPDLFNRAATLEENAMPYLKTVKGLGRSYSWKEQFGKE